MRNALLLLLLFLTPRSSNAQLVVSDYGDLGDSTINDGIYFPRTLRSAIQNANYAGVATKIEMGDDFKTIKLGTPLPDITVSMNFDGHGLTLEPAAPGLVDQGLAFYGNGSELRKLTVQNFEINGVLWHCDDGLIEQLTSRNNHNTQLQVWQAHRNRIGSDVVNQYGSNVFYGGEYGIYLYLANDNSVHRNFVGVDASMHDSGSTHYGITLDKCNRTTVRYNTASGNGEYGIKVDGFSSDDVSKFHSSFNVIHDNFVGTNFGFGGLNAIPNDFGGIMITNSTDDTIRNNLVSGNGGTGIQVQSTRPGSSTPIDGRVVIENNRVGVDLNTKKAIPNGYGISVFARKDIVRNNLVSGNTNTGIAIEGSENIVQSNIIGLDSSQSLAIPNGRGMDISNGYPDASTLVIGDDVGGAGNVVAGNLGDGIYVYTASTKHVIVSRNKIGINRDTVAFPNGGDGIHMKYSLEDIAVIENLISANNQHGIEIERNVVIYLDPNIPPFFQRPSNITIKDNCIGCVREGDTTGKHGGSGIYMLNAHTITIDNNVIYGTAMSGIEVADSVQTVDITRNRIGPEDPGKQWKIVGGDGIRIAGRTSSGNTIGRAVSQDHLNEIRYCKGHGIAVRDSAQMVAVYPTRFVDNELGGIALDDLEKYFDDGKFNDPQDADHGSNELQNTLEQSSGFTKGSKMWLSGSFQGMPNTAYRYDIYLAKALPEPEAHKTQGMWMYGWYDFRTDANGRYDLDTTFDDPWIAQHAADYPFATVTITGTEGTSSFSHLSTAPANTDVAVKIDTSRSKVESNGRVHLYATIRNLGGSPATGVNVRDTVSNFDLESITISKGSASIVDSTYTATIPTLTFGEVIEYLAIGKARTAGPHRRRVYAIPTEDDARIANNVDTIVLFVSDVNSVHDGDTKEIYVSGMSNRLVQIGGLLAGDYLVRSYDLEGKVVAQSAITAEFGRPCEVALAEGINLMEILQEGRLIYRAKLLMSYR